MTPYILIDFTYLYIKIKKDEKVYSLFDLRWRGGHFSNSKADPINNDLNYCHLS